MDRILKVFTVEFDNDLDTIGESVAVLALDITDAQVIAHEAAEQLKKLLKDDEIRVKRIEEQCFVLAPEQGFKIEAWLSRIQRILDSED